MKQMILDILLTLGKILFGKEHSLLLTQQSESNFDQVTRDINGDYNLKLKFNWESSLSLSYCLSFSPFTWYILLILNKFIIYKINELSPVTNCTIYHFANHCFLNIIVIPVIKKIAAIIDTRFCFAFGNIRTIMYY